MSNNLSLFDLPSEPVTTPLVVDYTDPCPGKKGGEKVWEKCGNCVKGIYQAPSSWTWQRGNQQAAWCFVCNGAGGRYVKVSSIRARVRRQAKAAAEAARAVAEYEANRPIIEWLEAEQAWNTEQERIAAEAARIATLVQGFVAPVGDKVRNLDGEVTFIYDIEFYNDFAHRNDVKRLLLVKLDNGKVIKIITTSYTAFDLVKGNKIRITSGTVKAHDNYKGQDQTTLTRARFKQI